MTTWDYDRQPENRPPQVGDHRPLLEDAGFDVTAYEETDDWRRRQHDTTCALVAAADAYAAEMGEDPAEMRAQLAEMRATMDCMRRRVLVVARRRG